MLWRFLLGDQAMLKAITVEFGSAIGLSRRQIDVLRLAAEGKEEKEIAASLGVSLGAVSSHIQRIFDKAGVRRMRDVVGRLFEYAMRQRSLRVAPERAADTRVPRRGAPVRRPLPGRAGASSERRQKRGGRRGH